MANRLQVNPSDAHRAWILAMGESAPLSTNRSKLSAASAGVPPAPIVSTIPSVTAASAPAWVFSFYSFRIAFASASNPNSLTTFA
jgi:hypothetical protein